MSWQLGSFLLLGLALAGGFAWYERMRPDSRIIALVATLAAFGALGRIAFAAVPNVKPTTDIVLIAGYALGGGPGFAVGALAGLASNFFFGQGPWTPWQMAAWGATGVIGAGLAWLGARRKPARPPRIGRLPLAVICGVVGFAFTVVQDIGDWVTYSDHSAAQLVAYVGQGLGFDSIHAAGCVAFALLLGPALIRSIQRFARRLQVQWVPPGTAFPTLAALLIVAMLVPAVRAPAQAQAAGSTSAAIAYLLRAQNPDGGFGAAPGQSSAGLYSGWAALGLASAGYDPLRISRGRSVIAYTRAAANGLDTGSLERTILLARAAGLSVTSFAGHDLLAGLENHRRADGSLGGTVNLTAFGVLALRSAGVGAPPAMIGWLMRQQDSDGGYGFAGRGSTSDIDDTGAVLEALAGAPGARAARARAVGYLRAQQDRDGGFPSQPGMGSNAQSTAWAVQGLLAAGVDPETLHRAGAPAPLGYLNSLIGADGSIAYARGQSVTPVWVTGEVLMALEKKPLPLAPLALPKPPTVRRAAPAAARAAHPAAKVTRSHPRRHHARRRPRVRKRPAAIDQKPVLELARYAGMAAAALLAPMGLG